MALHHLADPLDLRGATDELRRRKRDVGEHGRRQLVFRRHVPASRPSHLRHLDRRLRFEIERRVLRQDGDLQLLQVRSGIEAQLLEQLLACPVVGGQRVGLPPGAVQRQHQLFMEPFA